MCSLDKPERKFSISKRRMATSYTHFNIYIPNVHPSKSACPSFFPPYHASFIPLYQRPSLFNTTPISLPTFPLSFSTTLLPYHHPSLTTSYPLSTSLPTYRPYSLLPFLLPTTLHILLSLFVSLHLLTFILNCDSTERKLKKWVQCVTSQIASRAWAIQTNLRTTFLSCFVAVSSVFFSYTLWCHNHEVSNLFVRNSLNVEKCPSLFMSELFNRLTSGNIEKSPAATFFCISWNDLHTWSKVNFVA